MPPHNLHDCALLYVMKRPRESWIVQACMLAYILVYNLDHYDSYSDCKHSSVIL